MPSDETIDIIEQESPVKSPDDKAMELEKVNELILKDKDDADSAVDMNEIPFEKDNLNELDNTTLKLFKTEPAELLRLFRSIINLSPVQIRIIELRYLGLVKSYETRLIYIDFFHHFTRIFVSLGSVIVPALLSIQSPTSQSSVGLYWITWLISLLVTCFHNFITIFRFDKKHYALHATYEKLQNEGWSYLELSGRYSGHQGSKHIHPTHKNQFQLFVHTIEKLQMRQIMEEYNGQRDEKNPHTQQGQLVAGSAVATAPHLDQVVGLSPDSTRVVKKV